MHHLSWWVLHSVVGSNVQEPSFHNVQHFLTGKKLLLIFRYSLQCQGEKGWIINRGAQRITVCLYGYFFVSLAGRSLCSALWRILEWVGELLPGKGAGIVRSASVFGSSILSVAAAREERDFTLQCTGCSKLISQVTFRHVKHHCDLQKANDCPKTSPSFFFPLTRLFTWLWNLVFDPVTDSRYKSLLCNRNREKTEQSREWFNISKNKSICKPGNVNLT